MWNQSNEVHVRYCSGRNAKDLVKDIVSTMAIKEWGYYWEYDD